MRKFVLPITAMFLVPMLPAMAQATFQASPEKAVQHRESGWIFPKKVGKLDRKAEPTTIAGTNDVFAQYETGKGDNKIITTIYVYASNSAALDASYDGAKAAIEERLGGPITMAQLWSEGPFTVGSQRRLMGRKSFFKGGFGPTSVADTLYHFDTGQWTVKIRMTGREEARSFEIGDEFVRALPWDSLTIAEGQCTGYSCTTQRPVPIHGLIPEMLAGLMVQKQAFTIEDNDTECMASDIIAGLSATPKLNAEGLASPIEKVIDCKAGDRNVAFVRFVLPPDMLEKLVSSPDGLTLAGPFTFAMVQNGDGIDLADLHDGTMDSASIDAVLTRIKAKQQVVFTTWNAKTQDLKPVIRFVQ